MWWLVLVVAGLFLLSHLLRNHKPSGLPKDFNDLIKKVQTEENKAQIEVAIEFHNNRVVAGAHGDDSYDRLIRDIKRIGGIEEDEQPEV